MANKLDQVVNVYNPILPLSPYCVFVLNGQQYEYVDYRKGISPNFIMSLSLNRSMNHLGSFSFVITDCMDNELESKLKNVLLHTNDSNNFLFQFGWSEGDRSPMYSGMIREFIPQFLSNFNINFTVNGISDLVYTQPKSKSYTVLSYDELVSKVCKEEGWKLKNVVKCQKYPKAKQFNQQNQTSIDFLRKTSSNVQSEKGFPVRLRHECNSYVGSMLTMVEIESKPKIIRKSYNFMINAGNYGNVLSFQPSYDSNYLVNTKVELSYVNQDSNEIKNSKIGMKSPNPTKESNLPPKILTNGSINANDMSAILQNMWMDDKMMTSGYNATLEIIGDPSIMPLDYINIIPMKSNGKMHHTGGTYLVREVTDNLGPGSYTTTLSLVKLPGVQAGLSTLFGNEIFSSFGSTNVSGKDLEKMKYKKPKYDMKAKPKKTKDKSLSKSSKKYKKIVNKK